MRSSVDYDDQLVRENDEEVEIFLPFNIGDLPSGEYHYEIRIVRGDTLGATQGTVWSSEEEEDDPVVGIGGNDFRLGVGWTYTGVDRLLFSTSGGEISPRSKGIRWLNRRTDETVFPIGGGLASNDPTGALLSFGDGPDEDVPGISPFIVLEDNDGGKKLFDIDGRLRAQVDRNKNVTSYSYIDANEDSFEIEPDEIYSGLDGKTTKFEYDGEGDLESISELRGETNLGTTTFTIGLIEGATRLSKIELPAPDDPTELVPYPTRPEVTFGYDTYGRLSSVVDPRGDRTDFSYDSLGNALRVTRQALGTDSFSNPTDTYLRHVCPAAHLL